MTPPHGAQYDAPGGRSKAHQRRRVCRLDALGRAEAQPDRTAYTTWIKEQELTWRASCGYDANRPMTARRLGEFERWLEQRAHANPPEPIAPIVDRVMADIMARQRGGAGVRT
jgi:hypothetical protein